MLKTSLLTSVAALGLALPSFAADPLATFYDSQLSEAEHDIVSLAQALPADKYNFSPDSVGIKGSDFKGVRTFGEQAKHIATIIYMLSGAALKEKPPVDIGKDDNGPDALKTKEQIINYLQGSFKYAHKAIAVLTPLNQMDNLKSPFGEGTVPRIMTASMVTSHSFDHYGQMVVYARMNGTKPPGSR